MARRRSVGGWGVDTSEIEWLLRGFQDAEREVRPAIRRAVEAAAADFVRDVRGDASWSSRIPAAVRVTASFASRGSGVVVKVDSAKAPHARPYEGMTAGGNRGSFRHPVYGNRDAWVSQATRPFFRKNIERHREPFIQKLQDALFATLPTRR